ncbi:MAG: hypothetical protein D6714_09980 [Bacteroidetes bacterium]|nr:MAG: hypothetical protein D6714_09980 [Bacteroidota bacterium]
MILFFRTTSIGEYFQSAQNGEKRGHSKPPPVGKDGNIFSKNKNIAVPLRWSSICQNFGFYKGVVLPGYKDAAPMGLRRTRRGFFWGKNEWFGLF